ncbi:hypothetical protein LEP1GSC081_3385 [Leptospira kirschneri str. H1]|uniref:Uncharacterized protein n=1 Tax=Leptospira kirschneri str. H1 TaxID=1049966 RepID=A0A0E2B4F2_9LEPT|nr:hypothetical protein LEP1GSC081_3385 [Leptospira kirschneri str. H1]
MHSILLARAKERGPAAADSPIFLTQNFTGLVCQDIALALYYIFPNNQESLKSSQTIWMYSFYKTPVLN